MKSIKAYSVLDIQKISGPTNQRRSNSQNEMHYNERFLKAHTVSENMYKICKNSKTILKILLWRNRPHASDSWLKRN